MKLLSLSSLVGFLCLFYSGVLAQPSLKNAFYIQGKPYSIITLKPFPKQIVNGGGVQVPDTDIIAINNRNSHLFFYTMEGDQIGRIMLNGSTLPSPDFSYLLYWYENDIWRKDIEEYSNLSEEKNLTQLGSIDRFGFINWYQDMVYPSLGSGRTYALNTRTGELQEYQGEASLPVGSWDQLPALVSPDRRWKIEQRLELVDGQAGISFSLVDYASNQRTKLSFQAPEKMNFSVGTWITSDSLLLFFSTPTDYSNPKEINHKAYLIKIQSDGSSEVVKIYDTAFSKVVPEPFRGSGLMISQTSRNNNFISLQKGRPLFVSPGNRFLIFLQSNPEEICVFDFLTEKSKVILSGHNNEPWDASGNSPNPITQNSIYQKAMGYPRPLGSFQWVSPTKLIYATSGDLLTQGTWLIDVLSLEIKKVSPLVGEEFWVFDEADFVLFRTTNNKLMRVNTAGEDLVEMTDVGRVDKYSRIKKVIE